MKKIALVLAVLLCALPMMAFAEIAVTGSVSFELGNSDETEPTLPAFSAAKSATATVAIASEDEKVVATVGLNLLPAVTSTYAYGTDNSYDPNYHTDLTIEKYLEGYAEYLELKALVAFWNDNYEFETADEELAFGKTPNTIRDGLMTAINDAYTVDVAYLDDGDLTIADAVDKKPVAADHEFEFDAAIGDAFVSDILVDAAAYMDTQVDLAIDTITDEADFAALAAIATGADLVTFVKDLDADDYDALKADKAVVQAGIDLVVAYDAVSRPVDGDPTVTSAISYITTASLAFKDVAGVLDITMNLAGTHVAAGAISVDGAGHTDDAVAGYPSLMVGLSSGVVEGLNAGVTLFIDDNGAQDSVSDDFYTWMDETDDMANPVYGLGVNGGYTMAMEDMTVGASVAFGLYDLMDAKAWAFSFAPMFNGFGANVGIQFDYGMDMMYFMFAADYTIMGITPNFAFHYINATGDNVLAYASSTSSVMGEFKNGAEAGMLMSGGLNVDLTELVGMGVSVYGGADYGLSGDAKEALAWNAGLSVAGLVEGLTVGFDCDADSIEGSTFDYSVSASYAYNIATLSFSLGSDYSTADETNYTAWSVGTSVSF